MSESEVRAKLKATGRWREGMDLEPFGWLTELAPPGALDGIEAYRLIDRDHTPTRDLDDRNWTPVLSDGSELLVDASPAMFDALLRSAGYFEQPEAYGNQLLLQFHRFALDFYEDYQVREKSFGQDGGVLKVRGEASRGGGQEMELTTFQTVARKDRPAVFKPDASA